MLLPNEPEYLELIYACSWLGVIAVPMNARSSVVEIDRVLADASPRGLVRHSSLPAPTVQPSWELVLDKEPLDAAGASCPDPIYDPDAILALIYTSGTTGRPKGVVVTHANIQANIDHLNYWMPYREGGVHLHAAPVFHILDFPFIFAAPAFGTCQITIPKFSAAKLLRDGGPATRQSHRTGADDDQLVDAVPGSQGVRSDQPRGRGLWRITDVPCIGPSNARGLAPCQARPGLRAERNGVSHRPPGSRAHGGQAHVLWSAMSRGRLAYRGRIRKGTRTGTAWRSWWRAAPMSCAVTGTIRRRTRLAFQDGLFRTGDVGYRDADGYFYILDRVKDMIVTGGENVYSGEVEAVIYEHPAVLEAAVFGIPDPQWGELVAACVVRKPRKRL